MVFSQAGFLTYPFIVEGEDLFINAVVDRDLRVEVVDPVSEFYDSGRKGYIGYYIATSETQSECCPWLYPLYSPLPVIKYAPVDKMTPFHLEYPVSSGCSP